MLDSVGIRTYNLVSVIWDQAWCLQNGSPGLVVGEESKYGNCRTLPVYVFRREGLEDFFIYKYYKNMNSHNIFNNNTLIEGKPRVLLIFFKKGKHDLTSTWIRSINKNGDCWDSQHNFYDLCKEVNVNSWNLLTFRTKSGRIKKT